MIKLEKEHELYPRRMQRFYRRGDTPDEKKAKKVVKQISEKIPKKETEKQKELTNLKQLINKGTADDLALKEIKKFRKRNERYPDKKEERKIVDNIFDQLEKQTNETENLNTKTEKQHGKHMRFSERQELKKQDGPESALLESDFEPTNQTENNQSQTKTKQKNNIDSNLNSSNISNDFKNMNIQDLLKNDSKFDTNIDTELNKNIDTELNTDDDISELEDSLSNLEGIDKKKKKTEN